MRRRQLVLVTSVFAALSLLISGCSSSNDSAGGANCDAYSAYQGHDGTEVEIYSSIRSPEAEIYQESFAEFEECTGITINWNGTAEFEAQLPVRVEAERLLILLSSHNQVFLRPWLRLAK